MTRLAIVIVSYNTREDLSACLRSLHETPPSATTAIAVVDNASSDGSAAAVRDEWPAVTLIEMGRNVGFAAATNAGVGATSSDLVLLLNSDTMVPAGSLDRLIAALDRDPGAVAAGPRLIGSAGELELSFGRMIAPWNEARQKWLGLALLRGPGWLRRRIARRAERTHHPDWVSGACLLVRRAAGDAAGWLDERFFLYGEDVDFCAALRAAGGRIVFTPEAEVIHRRGRSGAADPAATHAAYRRSHLAFYAKHYPGWAPLLRLYLRLRRISGRGGL